MFSVLLKVWKCILELLISHCSKLNHPTNIVLCWSSFFVYIDALYAFSESFLVKYFLFFRLIFKFTAQWFYLIVPEVTDLKMLWMGLSWLLPIGFLRYFLCHFVSVFFSILFFFFILLGYLGSFHLILCKLHRGFWHTGVDGTVPAFEVSLKLTSVFK